MFVKSFVLVDGDQEIAVFGAETESLAKAHVKGYTRKDGAVVAEHDDNRQAKQAKTPALGHGAKALRESTPKDHTDHWSHQVAADHMESGNKEALSAHLSNMDTAAREHALDHIHPDHWEGLGFKPLDKERAKKQWDKKMGKG